MDMMTKLGGRKFLTALSAIGAAMYLEIAGRGLTPTMAGFLVSMVGLFHAANSYSSASFMKSKNQGGDVADKIDELHEKVEQGFAPERTAELQKLLFGINSGVSQLQNISGEIAKAMINQNQILNQRK